MANVYIPLVPMRFDHFRQIRRPAFDLSAAREFGPATILIPELTSADSSMMFDTQQLVNQIVAGMKTSEPDDFIVAIGDPALIAAAVAVQCGRHGCCRVLRWDKQDKKYRIVEFKL